MQITVGNFAIWAHITTRALMVIGMSNLEIAS